MYVRGVLSLGLNNISYLLDKSSIYPLSPFLEYPAIIVLCILKVSLVHKGFDCDSEKSMCSSF